jgi:hypothetical protein
LTRAAADTLSSEFISMALPRVEPQRFQTMSPAEAVQGLFGSRAVDSGA